MIIGKQIQP